MLASLFGSNLCQSRRRFGTKVSLGAMDRSGGQPSQSWSEVFAALISLVLHLTRPELETLRNHAAGLIAARDLAASSSAAGADPGVRRGGGGDEQPPEWCVCGGRCTVCLQGWCNKRGQHTYNGRCTCHQCHVRLKDRRR